MLPHPVAVAAVVHNATVMEAPVEQGGDGDFVTKNVALLLLALVVGRHRRRTFVVSARELKKLRARPRDWQAVYANPPP